SRSVASSPRQKTTKVASPPSRGVAKRPAMSDAGSAIVLVHHGLSRLCLRARRPTSGEVEPAFPIAACSCLRLRNVHATPANRRLASGDCVAIQSIVVVDFSGAVACATGDGYGPAPTPSAHAGGRNPTRPRANAGGFRTACRLAAADGQPHHHRPHRPDLV